MREVNSAMSATEHSPRAPMVSSISHLTGFARVCIVWMSSTTKKGTVFGGVWSGMVCYVVGLGGPII